MGPVVVDLINQVGQGTNNQVLGLALYNLLHSRDLQTEKNTQLEEKMSGL